MIQLGHDRNRDNFWSRLWCVWSPVPWSQHPLSWVGRDGHVAVATFTFGPMGGSNLVKIVCFIGLPCDAQ